MKITWTCVLATLALFVGSAPAHAKDGAKLVQVPAGDLKWEPFYPGGPEEAFIIGSKGAKKGPTGIILAGTILETDKAAAEPAKSLVAGSYYMQPQTIHRTQCAPGADCLVYIYEEGPFSFVPTDESGKPLPPGNPRDVAPK